jgi:hypothetical protein
MLAQLIAPETQDIVQGLVGRWQPIVAALSPVLLGLITSEATRSKVKAGLPLVVAAVLAVVSALTEDGMTISLFMARIPALWVTIEAAYRAMSLLTTTVTNSDKSINDILAPAKGLVK